MSQTPQRAPVDRGAGGADNQQKRWQERSGLVRQITLSAVAVAIGLAVLFAVLFFAVVSLRDRSLEAQRSQQVIAAASELQTLVVDMQTGVRGFIIYDTTEIPRALPCCAAAIPVAPRRTLLRLTNGNAAPARARSADYAARGSIRPQYHVRRSCSSCKGIRRSRESSCSVQPRKQEVPAIRDLFGKLLTSEKAVGAARARKVALHNTQRPHRRGDRPRRGAAGDPARRSLYQSSSRKACANDG